MANNFPQLDKNACENLYLVVTFWSTDIFNFVGGGAYPEKLLVKCSGFVLRVVVEEI